MKQNGRFERSDQFGVECLLMLNHDSCFGGVSCFGMDFPEASAGIKP